MRIARRTLVASIAASLASPAVLRLARGDAPQVTLKLHHFFSAVSCGHTGFLVPWARKVEAESGGRIRIDIFPSMQLGGAPAQLFDQVRDGLADIVWAVPSNTPERFPKIEVFELPFVPSHRALVNSRAIEDYAAANLRDEFREIHPICFSCRDHGVVHANHTVRSIEDLRGLRLHVPNRLAGEAVQALGARGVSAPIPQVPMAITGHVIDGCLDPWDVVPSLRLQELLRSHTDFAGSSLSTATFVLAMNQTSYDRLPRELKAVIDGQSGQVAAGMAGAMWDREARAVADMVRDRGDPVTVLAAEETAHWRKATEAVIVAWLKEMKTRKIDGGKLVASANTLMAKYADEPEPQPSQPQPERPSQPAEKTTTIQQPKPAEPQQAQSQPAKPEPKITGQQPQTSVPEPTTAVQPPKPVPQAKAAVGVPSANAAPATAPVSKRLPSKELDIPL